MTKRPELLLPVADFEMCEAAIHNGANAIYVGVPYFNARGRTKDLSFDELKEIIDHCHLYDVKVYVAFNVLIFEDEISLALKLIQELARLRPDAVIVQDLGLAKLIKQTCPELRLHASTQMTVTNVEAIKFLEELEIKRFVLGRENSLSEIQKIQEQTDKELEVFVHGALCVAYSGQCFTSEAIGGRSANRGQCAQSCRFSYDLYVDGKAKNLVDRDYLVSPKDLCGLNEVSDLAKIGVSSLKIEGRLKSPQYVASTAKSYSQALHNQSYPDAINEMAITYSRGFFSGWLHGVDHQRLVDGTYGSHRGLLIGTITGKDRKSLTVKTDNELENGQGIVIVGKKREEVGSVLWSTKKISNKEYSITLDKKIDLAQIELDSKVYLNSSPKLFKELSQSYKDREKRKRIALDLTLEAFVGTPLILKAKTESIEVEVTSDSPLEAVKNDFSIKNIQDELLAFGASVYSIRKNDIKLSKPKPFIPNKVLKKLRQELIEKLNQERITRAPYPFYPYSKAITQEKTEAKSPQLNVLLREFSQVEAFCHFINKNQKKRESIGQVILDFEFGKDYKDSVTLLKEERVKVGIATTRILKPKEYNNLNHILRVNPDFVLVRNLGAFHYIKSVSPQMECKGDFSLNISNSISSDFLFEKGLSSLVPSYDLNREQLLALVKNSSYQNFEVTIHQYMPSFHMEHCVFAAFLSKGSSFKDCGKPCEKHQLELKDQFGNRHFIKADQECRNTMYNASAQSSAKLIDECLALGVKEYRYEALFETNHELIEKIESFIALLERKITPQQLPQKLIALEKYGIGTGQLFKNDNYNSLKK